MATPCPGGNEIYNFGRPVLGHHYYILSLSELGLGVEKKIFFLKYAFSLYNLYDHAQAYESLAQGA